MKFEFEFLVNLNLNDVMYYVYRILSLYSFDLNYDCYKAQNLNLKYQFLI